MHSEHIYKIEKRIYLSLLKAPIQNKPMKKLFTPLSLLFLALVFTGCTKGKPECDCQTSLPYKFESIVIESSMKGWELYSWPADVEGCKKWKYALLPGTNKLKSYSEVTSDTVLNVTGEKQLKLLLSKFPTNEHILWLGEKWLSNVWGQSSINYGNLKLPASAIMDEIKRHCVQTGLQLSVSQ